MPDHQIEDADVDALLAHPDNPRVGDIDRIVESIQANGWYGALVAQRSTSYVLAGNHRLAAARRMGMKTVPVYWVDVDDSTARRILLADNRLSDVASYDDTRLLQILTAVAEENPDLAGSGYDTDDYADLVAALSADIPDPRGESGQNPNALATRFLIAPFSVLDARSGVWLDRKRMWRERGIRDTDARDAGLAMTAAAKHNDYYEHKAKVEEILGRSLTPDQLAPYIDRMEQNELAQTGTSAFDPVLAEIMVSWYSPEGGRILDPFAGGPTRGLISGSLGRQYVGIDLRDEQVEHNRAQAQALLSDSTTQPQAESTPGDVTPVEQHGDIWVKRDDLFVIAGSAGGKVRSCWHLADRPGVTGLITAGSRHSPQANIVASIAAKLGIPCRIHTSTGGATPEMDAAQAAGAEIIRHKPGYNTVIVARAREDADTRAADGWLYIPFGMEHPDAVTQTATQVVNIPDGAQRIVMPVGSGMSLAGVLHGLAQHHIDIPVLGIVVGADPTDRLDQYAPSDWRDRCTLIDASVPYDTAVDAHIDHITLDPHYEAKCHEHLRPGDLMWIVGCRETARTQPSTGTMPIWIAGDSSDDTTWATHDSAHPDTYDLVLTCPPYADLETYSDDPRDLSNMDIDGWDAGQAAAIKQACSRLTPGGFAAIVMGEARDNTSHGIYGLIGRTQKHLTDADCDLWAHYIMVTPIGGARLIVARRFTASRNPARTHQHILVARRRGGTPRVADQWGELPAVDDALATIDPRTLDL